MTSDRSRAMSCCRSGSVSQPHKLVAVTKSLCGDSTHPTRQSPRSLDDTHCSVIAGASISLETRLDWTCDRPGPRIKRGGIKGLTIRNTDTADLLRLGCMARPRREWAPARGGAGGESLHLSLALPPLGDRPQPPSTQTGVLRRWGCRRRPFRGCGGHSGQAPSPSWPLQSTPPTMRCFHRRCPPPHGPQRATLQVSPLWSGSRRRGFGKNGGVRWPRRWPSGPRSRRRVVEVGRKRNGAAGNEASIAAGRQRGHHPDDGHPSARGARPVNGAHDRSGRCRGSWRNEIAFNVSAGATREKDELASLEWRRRCGATGPTRTPVGPNNGHAGPSACSSREMGAQAGARWPLESIKAALPTVPSAPPPPPPTLTTARALHPHPHKGTRTAPTPAPHSAVVMVAGHPTHHLPRPTPSTPSSFPSWWCGRCLVATRSKCLSTL